MIGWGKKISTFISEGDMVTSDFWSIKQYFDGEYKKVKKVRVVNGPEGDAITIEHEGKEIALWSKYLSKK